MTGSRILVFIVSFVVLFFSTLYFLPATVVAAMIAQGSGYRIILAEAQGRALYGTAQLVISSGTNGMARYPLGEASWQLAILPLLIGEVRLTFTSSLLAEPLVLQANPAGWNISANRISLPLVALTGLGAPFNTLNIIGDATMQWSAWSYKNTAPTGDAVLEAKNVASRLTTGKRIGNYQITIRANGETTKLQVKTLEGPLFIEGTGSLDKGLVFKGQARELATPTPYLQPLLRVMGQQRDGVTILSVQ